ncbi:MAG: Mediator of RNA polymerase II transcription subunit 31 [Trebouxia sp. A1-2]|nr:MAG: Mediator of RNA polymerase II transcription subunit 31 [Trebouxia sp. A1-2]
MQTALQSETVEQRVSVRCSPQEVGCSDERRFLLELEFVQLLSSPQYLNWLSQNRFFEDAAFINYLAYLKYWKQPEYARFLIYPHSLFFLDCLQSQDFQTAMARNEVKEMVHSSNYSFGSITATTEPVFLEKHKGTLTKQQVKQRHLKDLRSQPMCLKASTQPILTE